MANSTHRTRTSTARQHPTNWKIYQNGKYVIKKGYSAAQNAKYKKQQQNGEKERKKDSRRKKADREKKKMAKTGDFAAPEFFNGTISLSFTYKKTNYIIPSDQIAYIVMDDEYDREVLPMIYMGLAVNESLYNKMMKYQNKAKFNLTVSSSNPLIGSSLSKNMISGSFDYVPAETDPDYFESLGTFIATENTAYRRILVGLVSDEMTTFMRRSFNNIYKQINLHSLITLGMNSFAKKTKKGTNTAKSSATSKVKNIRQKYDNKIKTLDSKYKKKQISDATYKARLKSYKNSEAKEITAANKSTSTKSNNTKSGHTNPKRVNATTNKSNVKNKSTSINSRKGKTTTSTNKTGSSKFGISSKEKELYDKYKAGKISKSRYDSELSELRSQQNKGVKSTNTKKSKSSNQTSTVTLKGEHQNTHRNWKSVIKQPLHNPKFKCILVPPLTSRYRFFDFLFDRYPFYSTMFRYYTDFDYTYLLDRTGRAVDAHNNQKNNVIIRIREATSVNSIYQGIKRRKDAYYVDINAVDSKVTINNGTDKISSQLVSYNDDLDDAESTNLNLKTTSNDSDDKILFVRNKSIIAVKNSIQDGNIFIEVTKQYVDGRVFTPNKAYYIRNYGDYKKYDGLYLISYKKTIFKNSPNGFIITVAMGFRSQISLEDYNEPDENTSTANTETTANDYYDDNTERDFDEYDPDDDYYYDEDYDDDDDNEDDDEDEEEPDYNDDDYDDDEPEPIEDITEDIPEDDEEEEIDPLYIESDNNEKHGKRWFGNEGHRSPTDDEDIDNNTGKKKY